MKNNIFHYSSFRRIADDKIDFDAARRVEVE